MAYCPNCGSEVTAGDAFCPACGESVEGVAESTGPGRGAPRDATGGRDSSGGAHGSGESRTAAPDQSGGGVTRRELFAVGAAGVAVGGAGLFVVLQGGGGSSEASVGGPDEESRPPPLDQVQVRLVDLRTPDAGVTSATIPILIAFENPTSRKVSTLTGDFDVFVNGTRVGSDEIVVNRLEPGEETNYEMDVIVEYADAGSAIVSAIREGSFDVRVTGTLNAGEQHREVTLSGST